MALFDFEIVYSGIPGVTIVPDIVLGITVYATFTNLFGETRPCCMYLNGHLANSGLNSFQVGGMAIGGALEQHTGIVVAHNDPSELVTVNVHDVEYDCYAGWNEVFNPGDVITMYEHISHSAWNFNDFIWNVTKKTILNPGILSINVDLIGSGGSGIGRVNIDPFTGGVHYGSGLGS